MHKKKIMICVLAMVLVCAFCSTAFAAKIGYVDNQAVGANSSWKDTRWYAKTSTTAPCVFNVASYNTTTPGFIRNEEKKPCTIHWGMEYKNSGSTGTALVYKLARSGNRYTYQMSVTSTQNTFRLMLKNSEGFKKFVRASYSPG